MEKQNQVTQPTTTVPVQNASQNATATCEKQEDISAQVLDRVGVLEQTGTITLPKGYHAGNALKSAWLYIMAVEDSHGTKALDVCSKDSVANALFEMVTRGEYPMKHCYFIVRVNQLTFMEKYTGKLMRAKRDTEIAEVNANVVREGEEFVYTVDNHGLLQLVSHKPTFQTMGNPIVGAYAVVVNKDGSTRLEVMTMDMIQKAWNQALKKGQTGNRNTQAHSNFADQMCKKTVIARACKVALESTSDRDDDDDSQVTATVQPEPQATIGQPTAKAIEHHDSFEANADYEEVKPAEPDYGTMGAPKSNERKCPI